MTKATRISIFGDNEIAREGLDRLLTEGGFVTQCSALDAIDTNLSGLADVPDHIIILDTLSGETGLTACRTLRSQLKQARIVLIGDAHDALAVREAFSLGVSGYVARQVSFETLLLILELIALGEKVLPSEFIGSFSSDHLAPVDVSWDELKTAHSLSDREISILKGLVEGHSNKIMARNLAIAEATVKVHVKSVLRKLDVLNRTQAAIWVIQQGVRPELG